MCVEVSGRTYVSSSSLLLLSNLLVEAETEADKLSEFCACTAGSAKGVRVAADGVQLPIHYNCFESKLN